VEEEEIRRQEQAARDQADAGSPREETGKFTSNHSLLLLTEFHIKTLFPSDKKTLFSIQIKIKKSSFHFLLTRCHKKYSNSINFPQIAYYQK
jgi:hypothetical protein